MFEVLTPRLGLIPLDLADLQRWQHSRSDMEQALGLRPSGMQVEEFVEGEVTDALLNFWLPQVRQHPQHYRWYTSWEIVLRENHTSIGGIGLLGLPNEEGQTHVGYMIDKRYRSLGYASEALRGLLSWAFAHPRLHSVLAETPQDNRASQQVLQKVGFCLYHKKGAENPPAGSQETSQPLVWYLEKKHFFDRPA